MRLLRFATWLEHGPLRHLVAVAGVVTFFGFWLLTFILGRIVFDAFWMFLDWLFNGGLM